MENRRIENRIRMIINDLLNVPTNHHTKIIKNMVKKDDDCFAKKSFL